MPENIEIKAKASDWENQLKKAMAFCDGEENLIQEDVFFNCPEGRLKLRILEDGKESYLVFYRRKDQAGPKSSRYETASVPDPVSMRALLSKALGEGKTVKKRRIVLLAGRTRIHFDEVESLGKFIELEVCLKPGQSPQEGEAVARDLMNRLGIGGSDLLEGAYVEMLNPGPVAR